MFNQVSVTFTCIQPHMFVLDCFIFTNNICIQLLSEYVKSFFSVSKYWLLKMKQIYNADDKLEEWAYPQSHIIIPIKFNDKFWSC
mgnify:CR=1 FL=1